MDTWLGLDTISKVPYLRPSLMATDDQALSVEQRLSKQLLCFSELSETLTLKLLEIEERLSNLEKTESLIRLDKDQLNEKILKDSQEKVMHLQTLLASKTNVLESLDDTQVSGSLDQELQYNTGTSKEKELDNDVLPIETEYIDDEQMPLMSA